MNDNDGQPIFLFFANLIDRVQEILEEKAEEADFTGYLPGASTYQCQNTVEYSSYWQFTTVPEFSLNLVWKPS